VSDHLRDQVAAFAKAQPAGSRVLDVGCGLRPYEPLFAHGEYVGIDVPDSGREVEGKLADRWFDGRKIPYEDEEFDAVICTQVLEHAVDSDGLLAEMHRVLRRGGRLLVTVPFMWGEHETPYDFRRFSSFGIRAAAERAGFEQIYVERLIRGVEAIRMLVRSEIINEQRAKPPVGALRRATAVVLDLLWNTQLRAWSLLYGFERVYVDNALTAIKS
jgi:ubiquinone/menaquinone biosynthesis C-methylase UbiE